MLLLKLYIRRQFHVIVNNNLFIGNNILLIILEHTEGRTERSHDKHFILSSPLLGYSKMGSLIFSPIE